MNRICGVVWLVNDNGRLWHKYRADGDDAGDGGTLKVFRDASWYSAKVSVIYNVLER